VQTGAPEGQTRDQLCTLQRKLLGVVAENDALKAVAATLLEDLQAAAVVLAAAASARLAPTFLSNAHAMLALDRLLNSCDDTHVHDLDDYPAAEYPPGQEGVATCDAGSAPAACPAALGVPR
jgi:hypothetical protein